MPFRPPTHSRSLGHIEVTLVQFQSNSMVMVARSFPRRNSPMALRQVPIYCWVEWSGNRNDRGTAPVTFNTIYLRLKWAENHTNHNSWNRLHTKSAKRTHQLFGLLHDIVTQTFCWYFAQRDDGNTSFELSFFQQLLTCLFSVNHYVVKLEAVMRFWSELKRRLSRLGERNAVSIILPEIA